MNPGNLKSALKSVLNEKEMSELVTSFDIIGSIAIIDIPDSLKKKEKLIGEAILGMHKNVRTVCKRAGTHGGEFRIRPVEVIAGERTTETLYKESDAIMRLDVNRVYFTPRLSHERQRIAELVKPGEAVGCWFAGVGPFALVIAKKQPDVRINAIELNPVAVEYMARNVAMNKASHLINVIEGDVRVEALKLEKCDRIVMPLPKGGESFLKTAFECLKPEGVIHFYSFGEMENPFEKAERFIKETAESSGRKASIISRRVVRPFSPKIVQVVLDIQAID